jgi:transposase
MEAPKGTSKMSRKDAGSRAKRRNYDDELKAQAVQLLLERHSASSIAERLGISQSDLIHRWKKKQENQAGSAVETRDLPVRQLELELQRVQRECEVLRKALIIFGREEEDRTGGEFGRFAPSAV